MSLSQTGWHFGIILVNSYWPFLFNAGHVTPIGIKKDGELTNGWEPESSALLPTGLVGSWQKWRSGPLPELIIQLNWFPHLYTWFSPFIDHSAKTFLLDTQIKPSCVDQCFWYCSDCYLWGILLEFENFIACSKLKDYLVIFEHFKPVLDQTAAAGMTI